MLSRYHSKFPIFISSIVKSFSSHMNTYPTALTYTYPFNQTQLNNKIRICTEKINSPLISLGIFINSGSRYESESASGSAHFLEHILFKGTKHQAKKEFELEVEQMGSSLNAYTSREHTLFSMECFPKNLKRCLKILSDMMQFPLISKKAVEEEKETIKAELVNCYSDPSELIMEMGHRTVFGHNTAMGRPILGEISNINKVSQTMVKQFHHRQYQGKNMVVTACGDVSHSDIVSYVKEFFTNMKSKETTDKNTFSTITPKFIHNNITYIYNENVPTPGIGVFYPAPGWYDKDYYVLLLIERILGQYTNIDSTVTGGYNQSRLVEIPLTEYPNILKYKTFFNPYKDCGLFGIMCLSHESILNGTQILSRFFPYQYSNYISDMEIERAKNKVYMELLSIQSPTEIMNLIGPQVLYFNRRVTRLEIAKRVSMISNEQVRCAFKKYFVNGRPSLVVYGNKNKISDIATSYMTSANKMLLQNINYIKH